MSVSILLPQKWGDGHVTTFMGCQPRDSLGPHSLCSPQLPKAVVRLPPQLGAQGFGKCPSRTAAILAVWVCAHSARLFEAPGTVAHQAPLPKGFPRREHWSGLPSPPRGGLPDTGIVELTSLGLLNGRADSLALSCLGSPSSACRGAGKPSVTSSP